MSRTHWPLTFFIASHLTTFLGFTRLTQLTNNLKQLQILLMQLLYAPKTESNANLNSPQSKFCYFTPGVGVRPNCHLPVSIKLVIFYWETGKLCLRRKPTWKQRVSLRWDVMSWRLQRMSPPWNHHLPSGRRFLSPLPAPLAASVPEATNKPKRIIKADKTAANTWIRSHLMTKTLRGDPIVIENYCNRTFVWQFHEKK